MSDEPKRRCSYDPVTKVLKIVMTPKRGKKLVEKTELYDVEKFATDDTVARFAYQLTKRSDGNVYELGVLSFGPECNCPHGEFNPNSKPCKHILAMRAAGLLPE
jgi:hypothetical protein